MAITFYHMADIHLDQPFSTLAQTAGFPSKRRQEILEEFIRVLELARAEQPDFVFISGDMYDHEYTKISTIKRINDCFAKIKSRIILICGNHDPESKNSFYSNFLWAPNVTILGRNQPFIVFEDKLVCIYGIGYDTGGGQYKTLETIRTNKKYTNILMLHGDVDLNISTYNAVGSKMLQDIGFDYVATGHNHRMYIKDNIYNPGSLCALGFDEPGSHGYFTGDLQTKQVDFIESKSRKYVDISMDFGQLENFEAKYPDKRDIYKIKVTGRKTAQEGMRTFDEYDYVQILDKRDVSKKPQTDSSSQGIKSRFESIMTKKMESASDKEKVILEEALELGLKALSNEGLDLQ